MEKMDRLKIDGLYFSPSANGLRGKRAKIKFENGYGASVITGEGAYSDENNPYEIAVLDANGDITYDTPITDDVIGHLDEEAAKNVLDDISCLPKQGA